MTTTIRSSTPDVDIRSLGLSWLQEHMEDYAFFGLPRVETNPLAEGWSGDVIYRLPTLENFLLAGELFDWSSGEALPDDLAVGEVPHTVTLRSKAASPRTRNIRSRRSRQADLDEYVPAMLTLLYQGVCKALCAYVTNASIYGTAKVFSGTDPLGDIDSDGTQQPLADIENNLDAIRPFASGGFEIECVMTTDTVDYLRRHVNYHGAGQGSGQTSALDQDAFLTRFKGAHRLSRVHVVNVATNTARLGQTATIARPAGGGVCWFGVCDRRTNGAVNMMDGTTPIYAPDGALNVWIGDDFFVSNEVHANQRIERFFPTVDFAIDSPRGSTMGFFFDPATILPSS